MVVGHAAGVIAALRQNAGRLFGDGARDDRHRIPSFVTAPLLTLVFGVYARLAAGRRLGRRCAAYMVLPVIVAGPAAGGARARLTRGAMIEVLHANYVRTARAKGLGERLVVLRHALPARCCRWCPISAR